MNYPLISEYIEAIKSAEDNFEELSYLRPVLGDDGLPVMTSGNFAVVFKMKDEQSGKFYAVKCFTKEQEGRDKAYREIAKELEKVSSPYILSIRYLDKELFVDTDQTTETEFPVLLMDWVEGKTLDKYLRENLDDKYSLEMLAYRFSQLAQWLIPQPFAHGDLKPDNILVREDGTLVLVDYDGMYVPAMKGQKARELGSPDFRHPLRTENDFDEHIDEFPLISILLSLLAITFRPQLYVEYGQSYRMLFSERDYHDIEDSKIADLLSKMIDNNKIKIAYSFFLFILSVYKSVNVSSTFVSLLQQIPPSYYPIETRVTEKDLTNYIEDDFGVRYSLDGKRLLGWSRGFGTKPCIIKDGTEIICDEAFHWYSKDLADAEKIVIPSTVKIIGRNPFILADQLIECYSTYFKMENNILYTYDMKCLIGYYGGWSSEYIEIPEGVTRINDMAFYKTWLKRIKLPNSLEYIGGCAFYESRLERIDIPDNVNTIGEHAFYGCDSLDYVKMPRNLLYIGDCAFADCNSLLSIVIPSKVISIGANPFFTMRRMTIKCESPLYELDEMALYTQGKTYLICCYSKEKQQQLPRSVTYIGKFAFWRCPAKNVIIDGNILFVGEDAFDGCRYEEKGGWYSYVMEIAVPIGKKETFINISNYGHVIEK